MTSGLCTSFGFHGLNKNDVACRTKLAKQVQFDIEKQVDALRNISKKGDNDNSKPRNVIPPSAAPGNGASSVSEAPAVPKHFEKVAGTDEMAEVSSAQPAKLPVTPLYTAYNYSNGHLNLFEMI